MLVLRQVLRDEVAARLSYFITAEAQYETLYGLYSAMRTDRYGLANVTEEQWLKAEEKDRFFRLRKFVRVAFELKMTPGLMTFMRFQSAFNDAGFKEFFETITDLAQDRKSSTFHSFIMQQGDCLGWHDDTD